MAQPTLGPFETPLVMVDTVVLSLVNGRLCVLLSRRDVEPEKGRYTLPGGFIHTNEDKDATAAAQRVLRSKTGLHISHLEQLYTFSGARRDRRGWSVSIAYLALAHQTSIKGEKLEGAKWVEVDAVNRLPFDHQQILETALSRVRNKASYSSLPAFLLGETFTLPDLIGVYEHVLGIPLDQSAFRRKLEALGFIEPTEETRPVQGAGRPARLYRLSAPVLQEHRGRLPGKAD